MSESFAVKIEGGPFKGKTIPSPFVRHEYDISKPITFSKIESEAVGEIYRCDRCTEIVGEDEREAHVCVKTSLQVVEEENAKGITELVDRFMDQSLSVKERCKAVYAFQSIEDFDFHHFLQKMKLSFPPDKTKAIAISVLSERIARIRKMSDGCYEAYYELRKNGVSYEERRKSLNAEKIEWCETEEKRILELSKNLRIKPWEECLEVGDQWKLRHLGLRKFISLFIEELVW